MKAASGSKPPRFNQLKFGVADFFFFAAFPFILIIAISVVAALSASFAPFFTASFNPPFVLLIWGFVATPWANYRFIKIKRDWSSLSANDVASIVFFAILTGVTLYQISRPDYGNFQSLFLSVFLIGLLTFILILGLTLWQPLQESLNARLLSAVSGKKARDRFLYFWLFFWTRFTTSDIMIVFIAYLSFILLLPNAGLIFTYAILVALLSIVFVLRIKLK